MSHATNYFEDMIARFFRTSSPAKPAALYVALFTTLPDESGANGVEVERRRLCPGAQRSGRRQLERAQRRRRPAPQSGHRGLQSAHRRLGHVVGFGLYDALTGGNAWILAPLETPLTVRAGDPPPIFAPGDLVVTIA